jgi:peptidoglycan hydrolase CwlO-like protein
VKALKELTTKQEDTVSEQSKSLTKLAKEVEGCLADVAKAKGEAAVIKSQEISIEVPELVGEANVESLEAYKAALHETIDEQGAKMKELQGALDQCNADLAAVEEAADAAAEAEAAAAAEAVAAAKAAEEEAKEAKKRAAAAKKRAKKNKKPAAVKKAEEEGKPTTGVRSRY